MRLFWQNRAISIPPFSREGLPPVCSHWMQQVALICCFHVIFLNDVNFAIYGQSYQGQKKINRAFWLVPFLIKTLSFSILGRRISLLHHVYQKNLVLLQDHFYITFILETSIVKWLSKMLCMLRFYCFLNRYLPRRVPYEEQKLHGDRLNGAFNIAEI